MKKIIFIFAIILIVVTCSIYVYKNVFTSFSGIIPIGCSQNFQKAYDKMDISLCESVNEENQTYRNPYYNNFCRESCIKIIAVKEKDPQLCSLINKYNDIPHVSGWDDPRKTGSIKDYCYRDLAKVLNDTSLLNLLETDWAREKLPATI